MTPYKDKLAQVVKEIRDEAKEKQRRLDTARHPANIKKPKQ